MIFIILQNLAYVLASINQISEHSWEDRLRLRKVNWGFF